MKINVNTPLSSFASLTLIGVILLMLTVSLSTATYYSTSVDNDLAEVFDNYNGNLAKMLLTNRKRSCIRRGASCDHRPDDCCDSSTCRCNIWGTNCKCQRQGLFQRWG